MYEMCTSIIVPYYSDYCSTNAVSIKNYLHEKQSLRLLLLRDGRSQQTRDVYPMLFQCWANVTVVCVAALCQNLYKVIIISCPLAMIFMGRGKVSIIEDILRKGTIIPGPRCNSLLHYAF